MVSTGKRMRYVSDEFTSSDDEHSEGSSCKQSLDKSTRCRTKSKWLSRNAIMARENRLKKKLYVANLESDVGKLRNQNEKYSKIVENQSLLITDLKKEIKYLKSVISNSSDIGKLIRNIHQTTGMSVTSSLDQRLSNACVSKPQLPIARKTAHPWEETNNSAFLSPQSNEDDLNFTEKDLFDIDLDFGNILTEPSDGLHLKEHDYTSPNEDDDVGVCLHVSKHRVSLEFCSTCSTNSSEAWTQ